MRYKNDKKKRYKGRKNISMEKFQAIKGLLYWLFDNFGTIR